MKNTEFVVQHLSPQFEELVKQWESEGFVVVKCHSRGYLIHECIRNAEERIRTYRKELEPIESCTSTFMDCITTAVKCKVKEGRK